MVISVNWELRYFSTHEEYTSSAYAALVRERHKKGKVN